MTLVESFAQFCGVFVEEGDVGVDGIVGVGVDGVGVGVGGDGARLTVLGSSKLVAL